MTDGVCGGSRGEGVIPECEYMAGAFRRLVLPFCIILAALVLVPTHLLAVTEGFLTSDVCDAEESELSSLLLFVLGLLHKSA